MLPGEDFTTVTLPALLDTLASPDAVPADASRDRLDLAKEAGSLEMALDTADTIQTADGLERMLAHQMTTAHVSAMKAAAVMQAQRAGTGASRASATPAAALTVNSRT